MNRGRGGRRERGEGGEGGREEARRGKEEEGVDCSSPTTLELTPHIRPHPDMNTLTPTQQCNTLVLKPLLAGPVTASQIHRWSMFVVQ